ncbi:MAG: alpha-hydroxy-acid oxidizing protein [Chromatiales bacterium]|nr:MAG: alpha-hydroxy-acid oxidizing protein [Chromatiales bacterium]
MAESGTTRRALLGTALASPWLGGLTGVVAGWPRDLLARPELAIPERPSQALDVFQLKAVARQVLDQPTWHFVQNGADDGKTMHANRTAFDAWQIRARRLVDVSSTDMSLELFGDTLDNPILLAPVGNQLALHADGELASARAAGSRHVMICSTVTSYPIGEIAAAGGGPLWFQLYASPNEALMRHLIAAAESAGCRVLVLTVDSATRGNREGERWFAKQMDRSRSRLGNFEGYDGPKRIGNPAATWELVDWLRQNTQMRIVLKGIVTREDAVLSVERGADGIIVSNHGGRQEESGRGTLESLPEVLDGAGGRIPVLIDGGFRRGTDIYKALALGARAICIGRPYLWGLGAFGEDGVARTLALLRAELKRIMQLAGTPRLADIGPASLVRRGA